MSLRKLVRNSAALQNLAARLVCGVPPEVVHNVEKLVAIRKAFAFANLEGITGDYLEFGVFQGTSLIGAVNAFRALQEDTRCRFFGFDSFEGLRLEPARDAPHRVFKDKEFATSYERVLRRIKPYQKKSDIVLVKGFFADTIGSGLAGLGIEKTRIVFVDCDLKSSAEDVFRYSACLWQRGTVLVLDDFFNYGADPDKGVCGAFTEFGRRHPELQIRDYGAFGNGGVIKIVVSPPILKT